MLSATPDPIRPLRVSAYTATSATGRGRTALLHALQNHTSGLRVNDFGDGKTAEQRLACWIGRVDGLEDEALPTELKAWECRNNRLAWLGLNQDGFITQVEQLKQRYSTDRVAIIVGTSTSSIGATEEAYTRLQGNDDASPEFPVDLQRPMIHTPHSLGAFVQAATGFTGPCMTVATACSSSAKVFAQAAQMINHDLIDAALVGGVDTLCGSVLFGFNSLGLVSSEKCRPFDRRRNGLSLGEASGFAILERTPSSGSKSIQLLGYGESSDAHHMSTPHPEGLGAQISMRHALARASLSPQQLDYLNLHGTATPANDTVEAFAVNALFPESLHASSTKGWMGHTLGAAGIVESVICMLALEHGILPGILNSAEPDPACGPQIKFASEHRHIRYAMNNSFGFGGNNCSLVFGKAA